LGKVAVSWLKIVGLGLAILSHETATLPYMLLHCSCLVFVVVVVVLKKSERRSRGPLCPDLA